MNFKRTIIALLVFAALISLYIVDSSKKKKDKKADETSSILSQIDGASMTEIKLTRNKTVISFIKDAKNGEWYINDPVEGKIETDKSNLSTLIESLGSIRKTESIGEVRDVEKYGLASPGISISINKRRFRFFIGKTFFNCVFNLLFFITCINYIGRSLSSILSRAYIHHGNSKICAFSYSYT